MVCTHTRMRSFVSRVMWVLACQVNGIVGLSREDHRWNSHAVVLFNLSCNIVCLDCTIDHGWVDGFRSMPHNSSHGGCKRLTTICIHCIFSTLKHVTGTAHIPITEHPYGYVSMDTWLDNSQFTAATLSASFPCSLSVFYLLHPLLWRQDPITSKMHWMP